MIPECGLRALGLPKTADNARFEHTTIYWSEDPNQVNTPHPHRELGAGASFPVSTDQNGLRAPLHGPDKPADALRVMTLGCSTTFGWGVADDESYPARLEAHLREKGREQVQVINAGQPGHTTFQGLWHWDHQHLADYRPDVVLIGYVVQDSRLVQYSDKSQALIQGEAQFLKQTLLWNSNLYLWMLERVGAVQLERKDEIKDVHRVSPEDYLNNLRELTAKVEAAGAVPVYFGFPLERVGYTELHRNILAAEAQSKGIAHFDPSAEIEALTRQQTLYFPQDRGHANAAGCDTIGQMTADFLIEQELVP